jgi:hypothetical protein
VLNAHIYHTEVSGQGHLPPASIEDIRGRLDLLANIGCAWWAIELKEPGALLRTKEWIDAYLSELISEDEADELVATMPGKRMVL